METKKRPSHPKIQKKNTSTEPWKTSPTKKNIGTAGKRCQKQASVTVVGFRILNHGNHPNVIVGRVVHLILETQMTLVLVELLNTPTMNLSKTIFSSNIQNADKDTESVPSSLRVVRKPRFSESTWVWSNLGASLMSRNGKSYHLGVVLLSWS